MKDYLIAVGLVVLVSAIAHAGDSPREEVFPSFNSADVVQGANYTWRNYLEWWSQTQETPPNQASGTNASGRQQLPNARSYDRTEREAIIAAATRAVRLHMTGAPMEQRGVEIPRSLWGQAIEQLHPLRVLDDRVNVFIVTKEDAATAEGLYVTTLLSSYAPGMTDRFLVFEKLSQPEDKAKGLYRCKLRMP